jgi:hypothetical protein
MCRELHVPLLPFLFRARNKKSSIQSTFYPHSSPTVCPQVLPGRRRWGCFLGKNGDSVSRAALGERAEHRFERDHHVEE